MRSKAPHDLQRLDSGRQPCVSLLPASGDVNRTHRTSPALGEATSLRGRIRPRVVLTGPLPPPSNGMTVVTASLVTSLANEPVQIAHVDTSDHRDISNVSTLDFTNVRLALLHGFKFVVALVRHRPDVVHVQVARDRLGFMRDALFLIPSRLARCRVILHLHSRDFHVFYRGERWWMRCLMRAAISPSWYAAVLSERFRSTFDDFLSDERVFVLPNGVEDVGDGGDAGERAPVALYLSTLWSLKGLFDFLAAAESVAETRPDVSFVLAGGWQCDDERIAAEKEIIRRELLGRVEFVGPVSGSRKTELLTTSAVLVLPSRYPLEGQPLVVLEAFAAGTPVVATDVGAIPDMVRDGVEGFLIGVGDVDALSNRIAELIDDGEVRSRMGRAARERYEQEYTLETFTRNTVSMWIRVANDASR